MYRRHPLRIPIRITSMDAIGDPSRDDAIHNQMKNRPPTPPGETRGTPFQMDCEGTPAAPHTTPPPGSVLRTRAGGDCGISRLIFP